MRFVLLLVFVTGCGTSVCDQADLTVEGICFILNDASVDPVLVARTVGFLEQGLKDYSISTDLSLDFLEAETSVEFVDFEDSRLYRGDTHYRGITYDNQVISNNGKYAKSKVDQCLEQYYVMGHELLHVVDKYVLGVEYEVDSNHETSYIFVKWADENGFDLTKTVEGQMYLKVKEMCGVEQ